MTVHGVRGRLLPSGEHATVCFDGDRIALDPLAGVELIADGGWILPGLVDVHTHPGADQPGQPLDETLLRTQLARHARNGVTLVRAPGIAGGVVPSWVMDEPTLPRVVSAGHWLAPRGGFFPGWAREVDLDALTEAAIEEVARSGGWCKLVVDWATGEGDGRRYQPTVPPETVIDVVRRVHDAGGRVAVHAQHPDGAAAAVAAGADSIEHGTHLSADTIAAMAEREIALVPTMTVAAQAGDRLRAAPASSFQRFMLRGVEAHPQVVRDAHEAGVTLLAGTDSPDHHGNVATEVLNLASAGVAPDSAVGAASWAARSFLGLPTIEEGAPADLVVFAADPRQEPEALRHPELIVLKGAPVR